MDVWNEDVDMKGNSWSNPVAPAHKILNMPTYLVCPVRKVECDKSLDPLGSDPNMGENKGQSNIILLTGC
jgi:hypothetical protein